MDSTIVSRNIEEIWKTAYQFAKENPKIWADVLITRRAEVPRALPVGIYKLEKRIHIRFLTLTF